MVEDSQGQILSQQQTTQLSPQQLQVVRLLSCPVLEIEDEIKREIEENPVLEEVDNSKINDDSTEDSQESDIEDDSSNLPDGETFDFSDLDGEMSDSDDGYADYTGNYAAEESYNYEQTYSEGKTFSEYLEEQLSTIDISEDLLNLCRYIIGNLDESGFLVRNIPLLVNDINTKTVLQTTETEMYEALSIVQSLEPAGVGARNIKECIRLQLERLDETEDSENALNIVEECFDEFALRHYEKIRSALGLNQEQLKRAHDLIVKMNPKPGSAFISQTEFRPVDSVTPDFIYDCESRELVLNSRDIPALQISANYRKIYDEYVLNKNNRTSRVREQMLYVKNNIDRAKMFISALEQRNNTLMSVMGAIIEFQQQFFYDGDESSLKPLTMKRVAERVGCDISTVSRVVDNKYIQTDFGIHPLKMFFSEGIATSDGDEVSNREIMLILKERIESEDKKHPLPDDKLCEILNERGYKIARRTIAKYREKMGIPVSRLRRSL